MSRPITLGREATYHHTKLFYTPFNSQAAAPPVLTADPWSFLMASLAQKVEKSRGDNKNRLTKAAYYAAQAEAFYKTGRNSRQPTKATLVYYGMLNLVKCFLSVRGTDLEMKHEHHGLQIPLGEKLKVQVPGRTKSGVNIFHTFSKEFDVNPTMELIDVRDILKHIPELHQISFSLGLLPNDQRCFLPVNIDLLTDENEGHLFSEIRYSKKQDSLVRTSRFLIGERRKYFKDPREENGQIIFRCKKRKSFTWDNLPRIYQNIIKEYSKFDIAMLLTRDGYKYYVDL